MIPEPSLPQATVPSGASEAEPWRPEPPRPAPGWMITFADLLSLLLAFFVLMFATMSVDEAKWQAMIAPIATYLRPTVAAPPGTGEAPPPEKRVLEPDYVATLIERLTVANPIYAGAAIEKQEHCVLLRLAPGSLDRWVSAEKPPLDELARLASGLDMPVTVTVALPAAGGGDAAVWAEALDGAGRIAAELHRLGLGRMPVLEGAVGPAAQPQITIGFGAIHALP